MKTSKKLRWVKEAVSDLFPFQLFSRYIQLQNDDIVFEFCVSVLFVLFQDPRPPLNPLTVVIPVCFVPSSCPLPFHFNVPLYFISLMFPFFLFLDFYFSVSSVSYFCPHAVFRFTAMSPFDNEHHLLHQ